MPKHKKTREQKKKADERKLVSLVSPIGQPTFTAPSYVFSHRDATAAVPQQHATHVDTVQLVRKDLVKTALISLAILAVQILCFFLLKNHVLAMSFVRY